MFIYAFEKTINLFKTSKLPENLIQLSVKQTLFVLEYFLLYGLVHQCI